MKTKQLIGTLAAAIALAGFSYTADAQKAKGTTPNLECAGATANTISIKVTAPNSNDGGRAGFSLQWMKKSDWEVNGWPASDDSSLCKASFSGIANHGEVDWNLPKNTSVVVQVGGLDDGTAGVSYRAGCNSLECNTEYVFRAFFHNVPKPKSADGEGQAKTVFSADLPCTTTSDCGSGGSDCDPATFSSGGYTGNGWNAAKEAAAGCEVNIDGTTYTVHNAPNIPSNDNLLKQTVALGFNICINDADCYANLIVCNIDFGAYNGQQLTAAQASALGGSTISDYFNELVDYIEAGRPSAARPYGLSAGQLQSLAASLNILFEPGEWTGVASQLCDSINLVP